MQNDSLLLLLCCVLTSLAVIVGLNPVVGMWDRFTSWWLREQFAILNSLNIDTRKIISHLRWWGLAIVVLPLLTIFVFNMKILAIPVTLFILFIPKIMITKLIAKRRQLIRSQLAGAMIGLANTCRAGLPIATGIKAITGELREPLRSEFSWMVFNHQTGRPLPKILEESKNRLKIEAFTLFAATLQTSLQRGGPVTTMLDRLSETIREMDRLERMMDNSTASSRRVIMILSIFPVIFLGIFMLIYPDGTKLMFSSIIGQVVLLIVCILICLSILWSNKILRFR